MFEILKNFWRVFCRAQTLFSILFLKNPKIYPPETQKSTLRRFIIRRRVCDSIPPATRRSSERAFDRTFVRSNSCLFERTFESLNCTYNLVICLYNLIVHTIRRIVCTVSLIVCTIKLFVFVYTIHSNCVHNNFHLFLKICGIEHPFEPEF